MGEPRQNAGSFGALAEFDRPEALIDAIRRARGAGFTMMDAYTPFPVEGLGEELGFRDRRVAWATLLGGLFGAALGFGMQVYTNLDYALDVGGRPLIAVPAFMLITFELSVLFAVLGSIGSMLILNRLPRLHHPLFDVEAFHLASLDKLFLVIFSTDPAFDSNETTDFLRRLSPVRVALVGQPEAPK